MTELKPCPFCGSKAQVWTGEHYSEVHCLPCGATSGHYKTQEAAIAAWNTRVDKQEQSPEHSHE